MRNLKTEHFLTKKIEQRHKTLNFQFTGARFTVFAI